MATEIDKCPIFIDKRRTPMQRDFASNLAAEKKRLRKKNAQPRRRMKSVSIFFLPKFRGS